jgi:hypothetical protein
VLCSRSSPSVLVRLDSAPSMVFLDALAPAALVRSPQSAVPCLLMGE